MCRGSHDGAGALLGFGGRGEGTSVVVGMLAGINVALNTRRSLAHEDSRADEDSLCAELHHERCIGGGGYASGGKIRYGELPFFRDQLHQFIWRLQLFG